MSKLLMPLRWGSCLSGLQGPQELNGNLGEVVGYRESQGGMRYQVQLDNLQLTRRGLTARGFQTG